ncbi:MAG: hypothetical protein H6765_07735 [Candidatus Peribacteria bacterium]|nr:MAG: hypothetical protein H6765_07735 [Candidatus Peribacteria bacterium]
MFDRKSYFYPDLPLGYQITQQWKPTCIDGEVACWVDPEFSVQKLIRIRDAHIETDTGKSVSQDGKVWLDYNRAGSPLVEVVTHPDFRSADEVVAFLKELQRIARYNDISDADMERGQMRVDVNISLRPLGEESYRTRVEMKNMNSFSAVRRAIEWEVARQTAIYAAGQEVAQETRGWDDAKSESYVMRSKEDAMDYRYMPEPDLPPLELELHHIDALRAAGIVSPFALIQTYKETYGFNKEFINGLI